MTNAVITALRGLGHETVPQSFYDRIALWRSWYDGSVNSFHSYQVFNGQKRVRCRRHSMGMAKKLAEDWADILMNEKVRVTLEGREEQAFFDRFCRENNFRVRANEMQELKAALGTAAYVLRVEGAAVDDRGRLTGKADALRCDYVTAEHIFPLSWENGRVRECAFAAPRQTDGGRCLYLQLHLLDRDGCYVLENRAYRVGSGDRLTEIPLAAAGLGGVPVRVETGSPRRLFFIDRLNIANNIDVSLPMGISVFANAIDALQGVDVAFDSYVNEFVLGKKRIIVRPEATRTLEGEPLFDVNDLTFYVLPEDAGHGELVKEIDMTLRTAEHRAGLEDMLNILAVRCGFGENRYSVQRGRVSTATQIVSENSDFFRTVRKHELILRDVLTELARSLLFLGNAWMGADLREDVEISVDFDESILEDRDAEFERDLRMLEKRILAPWEFRAKWQNEDEETARAALMDAQVPAEEEREAETDGETGDPADGRDG